MRRQCSASSSLSQWRSRVGALQRLMRLDRPVGIWLLLWPCLWSLALFHEGPWQQHLHLAALFAVGAIAMRSAGCIVNDAADRKFDAQVARTRTRPLASGELGMYDALALLAFLLAVALLVALQLHPNLLYWAAASLILVAAYPWMKRITFWPQAFLGLTFNLGALFGAIALHGAPPLAAWWLYGAGICWTIAYDTLYAHQDIEDDVRIGIKSTAIYFGRSSRFVICGFYLLAALCMAMAAQQSGGGSALIAPLLLAASGVFITLRTDLEHPAACLKAFKANHPLAAIIWLCFLLGH